jgi:hypothetical protein
MPGQVVVKSIRERIEADLARGDFARARMRLNSHLSSKGYNEELLTWAGRISFDMHDPIQAGRYWLVTGAAEERVEQAINGFARECALNPDVMVSQLPRWMRFKSLSEYPPAVQRRLQALGLHEKILEVPPRSPVIQGWPDSLFGKIAILCAYLLVIVIVLFVIGTVLHFALKLARLVWS